MEESDDRALAHKLLGIMHRLRHRIDADLRHLDKTRSIEPAHFPVLGSLRRRNYSVGELADRLEVSRPSMSKTVTVLVNRGWVERVRLDTDRRVVELHLTDDGKAILEEMREQAANAVAAMLDPLSPEERRRLTDGLDVLYAALAESIDGPRPAAEHGSDTDRDGANKSA